jgi:hypothetical protein
MHKSLLSLKLFNVRRLMRPQICYQVSERSFLKCVDGARRFVRFRVTDLKGVSRTLNVAGVLNAFESL